MKPVIELHNAVSDVRVRALLVEPLAQFIRRGEQCFYSAGFIAVQNVGSCFHFFSAAGAEFVAPISMGHVVVRGRDVHDMFASPDLKEPRHFVYSGFL